MEAEEYRAVIKHFFVKGWTTKQIVEELRAVHGQSAPCHGTVCKWMAKFRKGETRTKNKPRADRSAFQEDQPIESVVIDNRRVSLSEMAAALNKTEAETEKLLRQGFKEKKGNFRLWMHKDAFKKPEKKP